MNTLQTLQDILVKNYRLTLEQLAPEAELVALGLDSLSVLELMFKIEDRLKLRISEDPPADLKTVGDVVLFIDGQLGARQTSDVSPDRLSA